MTEYMIPAEPAGPVWDKDGDKWERKDGAWGMEPMTTRRSWGKLLTLYGPVADYPPEPDPWEGVEHGRLYWVTGHSYFFGKVRGLGVKDGDRDRLRGNDWYLVRGDKRDRLQSAVELTAVPTHLLDALIETAVDYDDPEDGTSVSREALHDLTDWLADHPQNKETK